LESAFDDRSLAVGDLPKDGVPGRSLAAPGLGVHVVVSRHLVEWDRRLGLLSGVEEAPGVLPISDDLELALLIPFDDLSDFLLPAPGRTLVDALPLVGLRPGLRGEVFSGAADLLSEVLNPLDRGLIVFEALLDLRLRWGFLLRFRGALARSCWLRR